MGISVPSTQYVVELASLFKVSTDYILGVDTSVSISVAGLTEKDIQIVHSLINHLKEKNSNRGLGQAHPALFSFLLAWYNRKNGVGG